MARLGFGPFNGTDKPMPARPKINEGDTVLHVRNKTGGVYWRGKVTRHDGRIAIKWEHLTTPVPMSDYGYNDIRKC